MQTAAAPPANSAARKALIREVSDAIMPLEAQIDQIREKIREHRTALKSNGVKAGVFNLAHHLRKIDDEAKRNSYRDEYIEAFDALSIGEQLDFLEVQERQRRAEDERATRLEQASFDGHEAGSAGRPRSCTWAPGSREEGAWLNAYDAAQSANRLAIGQA